MTGFFWFKMVGVFKIASFFAEGVCGSGVHGQILAVVGLRRVFLTKTVIVIKSSKWNGLYFSIWCLMRADTCKFLVWWPGTCKNAKKTRCHRIFSGSIWSFGSEGRESICTHLAHQSTQVKEVLFFSSRCNFAAAKCWMIFMNEKRASVTFATR